MSVTSRRLLAALRAVALLLIVLHVFTPLLREEWAWGVWPATYLPGWALLLLGAAAAAIVLWPAERPLLPPMPASRGSIPRPLVALLAAVPFALLRIQGLRWGDAYMIVQGMIHPEVRLTYVWQAPLDIFIHAKLWAVGQRLWGWADAVPGYWITSITAGVLFVWALLAGAARLAPERRERLLLYGLVLSLGTVQLFFGYVENYSILALGVLVYLLLGMLFLCGRAGLIWPATALAVTHAFHPSSIWLVPSLLYLLYAGMTAPLGRAERAGRGQLLASIAAPYLVMGAGVLLLMEAGGHGAGALLGADAPGGGDKRWFVPLFEATTKWEHYTMFSWAHLLDIANEQMLVAPVVLPSLLLVGLMARERWPRDRSTVFLLVAAGFYLLLAWTWNADYGGQRDWDLFAPAGIPIALLLWRVLPCALREPTALRAAGRALVAAQAFHTLTWIWQNHLPWPYVPYLG